MKREGASESSHVAHLATSSSEHGPSNGTMSSLAVSKGAIASQLQASRSSGARLGDFDHAGAGAARGNSNTGNKRECPHIQAHAPALDGRSIIGEESIDKSAVNPPSIIAK